MTEKLLVNMQQGLHCNHKNRNNCYVHVTFDCNLRCKHCYAEAGDIRNEMNMVDFERLVEQAIAGGFRQVIVTGGEPLVHSQRERLLKICETHNLLFTKIIPERYVTKKAESPELTITER